MLVLNRNDSTKWASNSHCRIRQSSGSVLVTELQIIFRVQLLCSNPSDNSQLAQQHLTGIFNIVILMEQSDVFLQLLQAIAFSHQLGDLLVQSELLLPQLLDLPAQGFSGGLGRAAGG